MDTDSYPGKGLSLSQLVFALNEELRRTAYPPLYVGYLELVEERHTNHPCSVTSDEVFQLERDISTALAAARELKNSFALINRIPSDILSMIPTHLDSQKDVFHASFVCRRWRRELLQNGVLWSQLFTKKGEDYVTTLLERAKGSALDIVVDYPAPLDTIALSPPHARRIRHLEFPSSCWADILMFTQVNSKPLPLLRTLEICTTCKDHDHDHNQPNMPATPSPPLFSGSVNLEEFYLDLDGGLNGSLDCFVFPNLTTLNLAASPGLNFFDASQLFDFLKASPTLRTVDVKIYGCMRARRTPSATAVVLPNVETFSLYGMDYAWHVYRSAIHLSCPRARYTSLADHIFNDEMTNDLEIFPDPTSWKTIVHQYTTSPVEEVTLEIDGSRPQTTIWCSLTFESSNGTTIKLHFRASHRGVRPEVSHEEMNLRVFSQACRTIQNLPLPSHVKCLRVTDNTGILGVGYLKPMADPVGALFKSLGPLNELTIHGCDLQIFLAPFVGPRGYRCSEPVFPHVQRLAISEALMVNGHQCTDDIVNLAKLQYELGKPFEHVTIRARRIPPAMGERLRQWVSAVDCYEL